MTLLANISSVLMQGQLNLPEVLPLYFPVSDEELEEETSYTELTPEEMRRRWEEVFGPYEEVKGTDASSDPQ